MLIALIQVLFAAMRTVSALGSEHYVVFATIAYFQSVVWFQQFDLVHLLGVLVIENRRLFQTALVKRSIEEQETGRENRCQRTDMAIADNSIHQVSLSAVLSQNWRHERSTAVLISLSSIDQTIPTSPPISSKTIGHFYSPMTRRISSHRLSIFHSTTVGSSL